MANTDSAQLVFLLGAIKHHGFQIDYNVSQDLTYVIQNLTFSQAVPVPAGRNANGIRQKINRMLNAFKPELDALKAGEPLPATEGTPKKTSTVRKRKDKSEDTGDADGSPKKRGRPKKNAKSEAQQGDDEMLQGQIQEEVKQEGLMHDDA